MTTTAMLTQTQRMVNLTIIRPAQIQDYACCVPLALALREDTHWADFPTQPTDDQIERWLQSLDCLFVAEADGQLLGLCGGSIAWHPLYSSVPYIWEQIWYVMPAKRFELIGLRLLRHVKAWGQAHGAKALLFGRPRREPPGEELIWHRFGGRHA